jgi:hypothetical protein
LNIAARSLNGFFGFGRWRDSAVDEKYDKNDKNENVRICESGALIPWPLSRTFAALTGRGENLTPGPSPLQWRGEFCIRMLTIAHNGTFGVTFCLLFGIKSERRILNAKDAKKKAHSIMQTQRCEARPSHKMAGRAEARPYKSMFVGV